MSSPELGRSPPLIRVPPPGPRSRELSARLAAVECPAFDARRESRARESGAEQAPIVYAEGLGANIVDVDGNRYVDMVCGFGALLLGHRPACVTEAVRKQQEKLWLALGDVYASDVKVELLERLAALFPEPGARVMLGSSGADAVTAALKTAVLATGKPGVVAFRGAYHGLSHGPLAACGLHEGFRAPFAAQLGDHVRFVDYPKRGASRTEDIRSLDQCLVDIDRALDAADIGAVLIEPVLGRGGCVVPPAQLPNALRDLCDRRGVLLIADEVWTGLGRGGGWLSRGSDFVPDIVCLGKGLGGGLPISACIGRERVMAAWGAHGGSTIHTATHFGSPLACAAALAVLDEVDALGGRASMVGDHFIRELHACVQGRAVRSVRGAGLMIGVELEGGARRALAVTRALLAEGYIVLTGGAGGDVLTLTPPLDVDELCLPSS